jgi:hypothetical protein
VRPPRRVQVDVVWAHWVFGVWVTRTPEYTMAGLDLGPLSITWNW